MIPKTIDANIQAAPKSCLIEGKPKLNPVVDVCLSPPYIPKSKPKINRLIAVSEIKSVIVIVFYCFNLIQN